MSRRKKHYHSSLNPEFDAVNSAIMKELDEGKGLELVCDLCHTKYIYKKKHIGEWCSQENGKWNQLCNGRLQVVKDGKMIKLPESIKTGKKGNWGNAVGYSTGSGNWTGYKTCSHPGDKVILEHDGKQIFASNSGIRPEDNKWDLIIDLAGVAKVPSNEFIKWGPKKYGVLAAHLKHQNIKYPEVLRLDWTDMGTPPVTLQFWMRLWELLPPKTVICCVGGHGRTGTCIAALAIATGIDYYSAVETVRKEHCDKAIESLMQELYLHGIYMDLLKLDLEAAVAGKNEAMIEEIGKDIAYATEHRPTQTSSYGDKEKESKKTNNHPLDLVSNKNVVDDVSYVNDSLCEIKYVHGVKYVKECKDKECTQYLCQNPDHLGWVMFNDSMEQWGV